jgi:hypothetical protein
MASEGVRRTMLNGTFLQAKPTRLTDFSRKLGAAHPPAAYPLFALENVLL